MTTTTRGPLKKRRIGTTDLQVTELGLGTATLAGMRQPGDAVTASDIISAALDAGISYFDTAPFYGYGLAERYVGDGLRAHRNDVVLSTKVGRLLAPRFGPVPEPNWVDPLPFVDVFDYSYDAIMRSFEDSLQRLGLNAIDILYVHDIGTVTHGEGNAVHWAALCDSGYKALEELKSSGTVSAIGLGVNEWEVLVDAFEIGDWDAFLLAGRYTLLEQTSLSPFLETCVARKSSVVVGGPFNSGILVGGSTWNYAEAPDEVVNRVREIEQACRDFNVELPAAALRFPLAHPAIASIIPGPRTVAEFDQILDWWFANIPDGLWDALAEKQLVAPGTPLPNGRTV